MELAWDGQIHAPAHIQAEIMTTPVEGFAFLASTPCAADAVVRIAFKGGDVFPQGRRFRIIFPWGNGWYLSSLDRPKPRSATDVVCRLSRGDKVEVFLDGEGDVIGGEFGFGLYIIPAFTDHPQIDPERRPSWYKNDTYLTKRFMPDWPKDMGGPTPGGPVPSAFPTRDVTVTYRSSANPGQVYTAAFSRSMQRIVVRTPGGSVATRQHVILDPAVDVATTVDDRHQTYFVVPYSDVVADRFKWPGLHPKAGGSEVIAGLSCTDYELETAGLYIPPVQPVTVCLTKDGVRLRRTQAGVTMTATSVVYGNVSADDCLVPDGYTRVQGEEDRKAGPRPMPMP